MFLALYGNLWYIIFFWFFKRIGSTTETHTRWKSEATSESWWMWLVLTDSFVLLNYEQVSLWILLSQPFFSIRTFSVLLFKQFKPVREYFSLEHFWPVCSGSNLYKADGTLAWNVLFSPNTFMLWRKTSWGVSWRMWMDRCFKGSFLKGRGTRPKR